MRKSAFACGLLATVAFTGPTWANEFAIKAASDPNNWAIQSGDYAGTRYSTLDQITTENVGQLKVAWTFSTGVLRGHEGGPLVIGDTMWLHSAFPNIVFALNLADEQKIIWKYEPKQDPSVIPVMCCDTVNRGLAYADGKIFLHQADTSLVALDAKTGKELWKVVDGDPKKGETGTQAPMVVKDKVVIGISGAEFGVRCHMTAYDINSGKKVWRAYSMGPDSDILVDPEKTMMLGKPVGKDFVLEDLEWRSVEDRWRFDLGLHGLRSGPQPDVLRHRQPLDLEPFSACGTGWQADRSALLDDDVRS